MRPWIKAAGLAWMAFLGCLVAGPARRIPADPNVILENDHLRAVINPSQGASLESISIKPDETSLLSGPSYQEAHLRAFGSRGFLQDIPFQVEGGTADSEGDAVEVTLSASCALKPSNYSEGKFGRKRRLPMLYVEEPDVSGIHIKKTYRLRSGWSGLEIEYSFMNRGTFAVPWTFAANLSMGQAGSPARHFRPTRNGVESLQLPGNAMDSYSYDIPAAWWAMILPGGRGLVAQFDTAQTSCLHANGAGNRLLAEFISTTMTIEPGQSLQARSWLLAIRDLPTVSFGSDGVVGGWEIKPPASADKPRSGSEEEMLLFVPTYGAENSEEITGSLRLISAADRAAEVVFSRRLNRTDRRVDLGRQQVALKAGECVRIPVSLRVQDAGTWLLRAEVHVGGRCCATGEYPLDVGHRTGFFLPRPEAGKSGLVYEDFRYAELQGQPPPHEVQNDWQPKAEYVSPHVPYGRPYARGPIRALFICPFETARGILELWERVELEYDCAAVGIHGYSTLHKFYSTGIDHAGVDEVDRVKDLLQRPHDVIVLGHYLWGWYPPEVQEEIIRQFKEGTGVVIGSPVKLFGFFEEMEKKAQPAGELYPDAEAGQIYFPGDFCKVAVYQNEFEEEGGRFAILPTGMPHLRPQTWIGPVENDVERIVRALVWAARKEPLTTLEISGCPSSAPNDEMAGKEIPVKIHHPGPAALEGTLKLAIRRDLASQYPQIYGAMEFISRPYASWEIVAELAQPVNIPPKGLIEVPLRLPWLCDGLYSLDGSIVDAAGRVVAWYRQPLRVHAPAEISEVWLSKQGWEAIRVDAATLLSKGIIGHHPLPVLPLYAADPLTVRLRIQAREGWPAQALFLAAELTDRPGRVFGRTRRPLSLEKGQAEVSFGLSLEHSVHLMNILGVRIEDQEHVLSETRIPLPIHRRLERTSEYKLRMYGYSLWQADKTGVDIRSGIMWAGGCFQHAWVDQGMEEWGEYLERATEITPEFVRIPCLTNPDYRERSKAAIRTSFRSTIAFVPPRSVLADEWTYCLSIEGADAAASLSQCRCRYCLERFQRFLRLEYRTLDSLNETWGAKFNRWEEATPPLFDASGLAGLSEERLPQVLDHRCFIDTQVGEYVGLMNQEVKKLDPACEVGISGNEPITPWNNLDIWQLAKNGKHNTVYRYQSLWESFGVVGVSQWTGYSHKYSPPREHERAWALFVAGQSVSYYGKENDPIWMPDYSIFPGPAELFRAVKEIKNGLAQLLWTHKARDPVALVYHTRSIYADMMERYIITKKTGKPSHRERGGHALNAGSSLEAMLNHSLIQPYWVSYEQLQKRNWQGFSDTRLIFLPYTISLRPDQVETIRILVKEGATVVGDVNTGLRDGHGKWRKAGSLDEIFGIAREGEGQYPVLRSDNNDPNTRVRFDIPGVPPFEMSFLAVSPPQVRPTTAKPHASYEVDGKRQPALLVNSFGKGKGILLNFIPSDYFVVTASDAGAEISLEEKARRDVAWRLETIMAWILEQAGVRPPLSVLVDGQPGHSKTFRRFQRGRHVYLGFCGQGGLTPRNYERSRETAILDSDAHLYDIRKGQYLGFGREIQIQYGVLDVARLYACLPYKVEKLVIQWDKPAVSPGEKIAFSVAIQASLPLLETDPHRVRVEVTDADGQYREFYRYIIPAEGGKGRGEIPVAENDPPGIWKLRLTDVATGVSADAAFTVEKKSD